MGPKAEGARERPSSRGLRRRLCTEKYPRRWGIGSDRRLRIAPRDKPDIQRTRPLGDIKSRRNTDRRAAWSQRVRQIARARRYCDRIACNGLSHQGHICGVDVRHHHSVAGLRRFDAHLCKISCHGHPVETHGFSKSGTTICLSFVAVHEPEGGSTISSYSPGGTSMVYCPSAPGTPWIKPVTARSRPTARPA